MTNKKGAKCDCCKRTLPFAYTHFNGVRLYALFCSPTCAARWVYARPLLRVFERKDCKKCGNLLSEAETAAKYKTCEHCKLEAKQ